MTTPASGLSDRLVRLHHVAHEWAAQMRPFALEVDRDPGALTTHLNLAGLSRVGTLQVPPDFNPDPLRIDGETYFLMDALERVVLFEEGAWADLGMVLGSPGAPMAGVVVDALGDAQQKERFFGRLLSHPTWTFFALTEPVTGSDSTAMLTRLGRGDDECPMALHGAKHWVGNAVRAQTGVVFARSGPGPLGFSAVLVDSAAKGFDVRPIDTLGVRAAQLGAMTFDGVAVPRSDVLGNHLSPTRRGMWAWTRTFNLLRPTVATMGVGVARAALDYVDEHRRNLTRSERLDLERLRVWTHGVRMMTRQAAAAADRDPSRGHLSSAAKLQSARLAAAVTRRALTYFGAGARLEHPLLDKFARDAAAVEYMEGTSNIQRLNIFAGRIRKRERE